MQGIGGAIVGGFFMLIVGGFFCGAGIVGAAWIFTSKDYIESRVIIKPEIRLETDGKVIDTVYIYKEPN